MTPTVPTSIKACFVMLGLLVASPATSDARDGRSADRAKAFEDAIAVEVVNIDVVVVDKKGRLVNDLSARDFQLTVDGRPVPITHFASARTERTGEVSPDRRVETTSTVRDEPHDPETSHLVVFIDDLFLEPAGRSRVLERLPAFVDAQLATGARIMVVSQDLATTVVQPFSTDREEITQALARVLDAAPSGLHLGRSWVRFTEEASHIIQYCPLAGAPGTGRGTGCGPCQAELVSLATVLGRQTSSRRQTSIAGLEDVVSALSGIPGRKSMLYVSDGFAQQPGYDAFYYLAEICPEVEQSFRSRLRDEPGPEIMHTLTAHANANRVTIFALEASGLQPPATSSVVYASPDAAPSSNVSFVRRANTQGSLFFVAEQTGGKAILNTNDPTQALETVNREIGSTYSIGFQVDHPADSEIHYVGVRLVEKRAGYDVRHRRSFLHKPAREAMGERTLGALLFGMEANPLGARATIQRPAPSAGEAFRVPITIDIPRDRLMTLPQETIERGRLTVILAAELEGTTVRKQELNIARPLHDEHDGSVYRFGVEIDLPAGEHLLGIGLWDRVAQEASFLRIPVDITTTPPDDDES